ncbi:hypothetical protein [Magnetospirillum sp. ME-1]|uniref:hypothetical protein n=1 Tax=Magnetospirillum sp. ME-1 TaxID=1639348 RepID=UPI0011AE8889|nr:hypothetical protein [Magnetospirillum sp. ME-1]
MRKIAAIIFASALVMAGFYIGYGFVTTSGNFSLIIEGKKRAFLVLGSAVFLIFIGIAVIIDVAKKSK